jgi:hypothetical protein
LREPEAGEDLARLRLQRVAAQIVEARLHGAEALEQRVHLVAVGGIGQRLFEFLELRGDLGHRAGAGHHLGDDGAPRHLADVLAEVADRDVAFDRDLPVVGCLLPHDHAEDRRLARAVRPDQADLLAAEDRRGRVDEQDLRAVLLADLIEPDHRPRSLLDQSLKQRAAVITRQPAALEACP